jgi:diguanylate cyclase (GGDEF)-like protein
MLGTVENGLRCSPDIRELPIRTLILSVAILAASLFPSWAEAPATLTSLRAIHALSNSEADRANHVIFQATVVYSRGYEKLLFVQDGDEAIFVNPPTTGALLPGDRVLIKGDTQQSFRPLIVASDITLLYHGALPNPKPATFKELIRAEYDCQLITVHATVRATDVVVSSLVPKRSSRLQLLMSGGHLEANMDIEDESALRDLLDDDVEVTGVAAGKFDNKMQQTGVVLYVSSLADVRIVKQVNASPWVLPVTPMDQVLAEYDVSDLSRRIRVHGTITYYQPGAAVVFQEGSKSLWIATHTREPLQIGDLADATGFPDAHDRILTLTDGEIRDSQIQAPVTPQSTTWEQLAFWNRSKPVGHQDDLVSIDGEIVTEVRDESRDEYVVESDGRLFTAIYHHPIETAALLPMRQVPPGSKVRIVGICTILDTNAMNPSGHEMPFEILLRSFDDIAVLAKPSLLNVRNLILLVGLLLVLLFAAGARSWLIERRVRRENAAAAYVERRRSRILEDINGSRPLAEIIEQITELVSFKLYGAPCWCQIVDGAKLGNCPHDLGSFRVVGEQIPARSGSSLGTISAAFDPLAESDPRESETLSAAAGLAALAIETRRLYSDLLHRSEFDLLTDINNRFSLEKFIDQQIERARQDAAIFGLIYIDLNDFKQVNDIYGHQVGDLYLQEVAARMKCQLRSVDMLARLGGDEFAVVVPLVHSRKELEEVTHRLKRSFDAPYAIEEHILYGSASVPIGGLWNTRSDDPYEEGPSFNQAVPIQNGVLRSDCR